MEQTINEASYWEARERKQQYYRKIFEEYKEVNKVSHNEVYRRFRSYCEIYGNTKGLVEWMLDEMGKSTDQWHELESNMKQEIAKFGCKLLNN